MIRIPHRDKTESFSRVNSTTSFNLEVAHDGRVFNHRLEPRFPIDSGRDSLDEGIRKQRVGIGAALGEALVKRHPAVWEPARVSVNIDERPNDFCLCGRSRDRI